MIKGIGIDTVLINDFTDMIHRADSNFLDHTFSVAELTEAKKHSDHGRYLASRFAAKEACFKAVRPSCKSDIDPRIFSILNKKGGEPYVRLTPALREILKYAGIDRLHISITDEGNLVTCVAISEEL